jgi:Na+-driven multidrug efflux pump
MTAAQAERPSKEFNLFFLTWPIFLELLLFMLMGVADTFMLSAISDNAVSGVGASNQYLFIALLVLEVVGNGASIVVAQYIGSRQMKEAAKISALSITLNVAVGLVMSIVFVVFNGLILQSLNLHGEVLEHAKTYLSFVGGFIFLQALINSISAIIRVHGFTKEAMFVSLGMNIVHLIGNYTLIFGHFGFSEMGVHGAAISTVISRALALLVFFWMMYRIMEVRVKIRYYFTLSKTYIGKILRIGIPPALHQQNGHPAKQQGRCEFSKQLSWHKPVQQHHTSEAQSAGKNSCHKIMPLAAEHNQEAAACKSSDQHLQQGGVGKR